MTLHAHPAIEDIELSAKIHFIQVRVDNIRITVQ